MRGLCPAVKARGAAAYAGHIRVLASKRRAYKGPGICSLFPMALPGGLQEMDRAAPAKSGAARFLGKRRRFVFCYCAAAQAEQILTVFWGL